MCGIVGAVAQRDVAEILVEGLRRLEYRGYDSAGVAVFSANQPLQRVRRLGKVAELAKALEEQSVHGGTGIAHTRWATHGEPSERNAHPHVSEHIVVVHNGIIENHEELRAELQDALDCMKKDGTMAKFYEKWFNKKPAADDLAVVITPGYGVPGMPGYDPTPHELKCN